MAVLRPAATFDAACSDHHSVHGGAVVNPGRRAYVVRRVSRCTVSYLVWAKTSREATELAKREEGTHLDTIYSDLHWLRPQRAPGNDD